MRIAPSAAALAPAKSMQAGRSSGARPRKRPMGESARDGESAVQNMATAEEEEKVQARRSPRGSQRRQWMGPPSLEKINSYVPVVGNR